MKEQLVRFGMMLLWVIGGACTQNEPLIPPEVSLGNTTPLAKNSLLPLEGIYRLVGANDALGTEFVCKVTRRGISFFGNRYGIVMALRAGIAADSSIVLAGYWRFSEKASQGKVYFLIPPARAKLLIHQQQVTGLNLIGFNPVGQTGVELTLQYSRDFSAVVKATELAIFGHHGIETNANPPFLENTLNAVLHCEEYGANGLEVDVRLTKDHVPVLYHDPDLNIRVVEKSGILANIDQVPFSTLYSFVRLHDGQRIPSLDEALAMAIDSTDLRYLWLDIKGNPDVFLYLEPIVRKAIGHATAIGRNMEIITDMPTEEVIAEYQKQPSYATLPVMCELELAKTLDLQCGYWGPRWTLGTVLDDVANAHQHGLKVYTWTLNSEDIIVSYLQNGKFDGLITDYPPYAVYHYYSKN